MTNFSIQILPVRHGVWRIFKFNSTTCTWEPLSGESGDLPALEKEAQAKYGRDPSTAANETTFIGVSRLRDGCFGVHCGNAAPTEFCNEQNARAYARKMGLGRQRPRAEIEAANERRKKEFIYGTKPSAQAQPRNKTAPFPELLLANERDGSVCCIGPFVRRPEYAD